MTEPTSQAAKQRACNLANASCPPLKWSIDTTHWERGLMLTLAQLCQDISDALEATGISEITNARYSRLRTFILPEEPDVLAEAWADACKIIGDGDHPPSGFIPVLRAALAQRGHEVAPIAKAGA